MLSFSETCLFLLIGLIVSLDVAGLTAVRSATYVGNGSTLVRWSVQNAFWHAVLLAVYGAATVAIADWALPQVFISVVRTLRELGAPRWAENVAVEVANHILVGFATLTVMVVWRAYARKIVENPFNVPTALEGAERGLVRRILSWFHLSPEAIELQVQSVAVALDMLALAFLLRSLHMFNASDLMSSYARVCAISSLIFTAVFCVTLVTQIVMRRGFSEMLAAARRGEPGALDNLIDALKIMRLLEPLLIFYSLCEMMSFTVWRHASASSLMFGGAALLMVALIKQVRLDAIDAAVRAMVRHLVAGH